MLDLRMGFIVPDLVLAFSGILIWFSQPFAHFFGLEGFFTRLFAGTVCFILVIIITFIATRN